MSLGTNVGTVFSVSLLNLSHFKIFLSRLNSPKAKYSRFRNKFCGYIPPKWQEIIRFRTGCPSFVLIVS